ncbi:MULTISPECIES: ABC transporter substrate-binding protein [unclassified Leucobacter]|uniref:ABC transporter substrate-binding protein n=1 Tax=unclassified Leucobacter TaxID=2621730 RepID=UPI00165E1DAA|nr:MULTISPECIES: ABC transporter substrate-binding protein [unclassified Leucobacter]MBC9936531.1 ABC transporter substrate-binding protein [Leucobacter sp. cx-87]
MHFHPPVTRTTGRLLLAGSAALALVLTGCAGGGGASAGSSAAAPTITSALPAATGQADKVVWGLTNEPSSLDPIKPSDFPPQQVVTNVCESLLKLTPDMTIEPNLALSWENPAPTQWVYQLRPGVTFHGGGEMTAEDVAYSLNRAANYDLGSMVAGAYDVVETIEPTGPLEITVTLKTPDVTFHQEMATNTGRIVSKATTEAQGDQVGTPNALPDCTGPFELSKWNPGENIELNKFDGYWDNAGAAQTDQLEFVFVRDAAARVNGMLSGEIQGMWQVPSAGFTKLAQSPAGNVFFGETSGGFIGMVTNLDGGLKDTRVRQALAMAVDREGIVKAAAGGAAAPLYTVASSGSWGYAKDQFAAAATEIEDMPRSLEAAKQLVADAGPQPTITIAATSAQPEIPIVAAEIQRAGKEIGLDIEIKTIPEDSYNALYADAAAREGIDMIFSVWQTYYPDPVSVYTYLQSDNFYNFAGWKNDEFDALISEARQTADNDARAELLIQAQSIANEDPTWIPFFQPFNSVFLGTGLTGVPTAAIQHNVPWAATLGAGEAVAP